jgi:outer membrane lipoprotein-sorting protein
MKTIYKDNEREIVQDGETVTIYKGGKKIISSNYISLLSTTTQIMPALASALRKQGYDLSQYFYFRGFDRPVVMPIACRAAVDNMLREYKAIIEQERNKPENVEWGKICELREKANRIANSDREDNVQTPILLRKDADELEKQWRIKYQGASREQDAQRLEEKADREEEIAKGALVYDADGWLSSSEQQKRHDGHMAQATEYRNQAKNLRGGK